MSEVMQSWTRAQLVDAARDYMVAEYGKPIEMADAEEKDRWRDRLGLLTHFVTVLWEKRS